MSVRHSAVIRYQLSSTASQIHRITRIASAWANWATWIATAPSKIHAVTLAKVRTYILCAAKYSSNVYPIQPFSYRAACAIIITISIRAPCVKFHRAAHWKSSIIQSLQRCCRKPSTMATSRCSSSPKCARSEWVSLRVGVLNIIVKTLHRHHAGWKFICTVHCNGWIRFSHKWIHR